MKIQEIKAQLQGAISPAELAALRQDERAGVRKLLAAYDKKQAAAQKEKERLQSLMLYENKYYARGIRYVAGIDEVGRGPLAGPLVMAAVILPRQFFLPHLNDSKKLSPARREELYPAILQAALEAVVCIVSPGEIDALNIYRATQKGMELTLSSLELRPAAALVDAMHPQVPGMEILPLIHGDALSASIAAASIVAKVYRDRMMVQLGQKFPGYGWAENKGYGSQLHMEAIAAQGATKWHRRSFEPVRSLNLKPLPVYPAQIVTVKAAQS